MFLEAKRDFSLIPDIIHNKLIDYLKIYYIIGGMPESVKTYRDKMKAEALFRTNLLNFAHDGRICNIPLYAALYGERI